MQKGLIGWSGVEINLEGVVLEALQGDLQLAAQLIPVLHTYFASESARGITQKIRPWLYGVNKFVQSTGPEREQTSRSADRNGESIGENRKRQRTVLSHGRGETDKDDEDENSEDEVNQRPKGANGPLQADDGFQLPRLACPFHKRDPEKYGIRHGAETSQKTDYYRACEGPGFKSIQRLK